MGMQKKKKNTFLSGKPYIKKNIHAPTHPPTFCWRGYFSTTIKYVFAPLCVPIYV